MLTRVLGLMLVVSALLASSQILLKRAVLDTDAASISFLRQLSVLAGSLHAWLAIAATISAGLVWLTVLRRHELTFVYPLISISYVLVALAGRWFLGERLTIGRLAGTVIICVGIGVLLSSGGGREL